MWFKETASIYMAEIGEEKAEKRKCWCHYWELQNDDMGFVTLNKYVIKAVFSEGCH